MIAARLCASAADELVPAVAEGPEGERVDPGRQPGADGERLHPERAAQLFVLVLGVAQDQGAVAEVHHPQQERLHGGGLAAAGFAEDEHVRVGDRHRVVEDPAERVGVEAAAGQQVDAHLGAGRRQAGGGDERPQHRRLVRGHPPRRHRRLRRRPAAAAAPAPAAVRRTGTAGASFASVAAARCGGQVVAEVGEQPGHVPTPMLRVALACGRGVRPVMSRPRRVRLTPRGTVEAANPTSWARSSRSGREPGAADRGVEAAAVFGDPGGLGHGDGADRVRAGQRVAAGEFGVDAAGFGGLVAAAGALFDLGFVAQLLAEVGGPFAVRGPPVRGGLVQDRVGDEEAAPLPRLARGQDRRQRPHHRALGGQGDGGADRVPGVVAVVPDQRVGAGRPGHGPRHVGVHAGSCWWCGEGVDDAGAVGRGEAGAARQRQLRRGEPGHLGHAHAAAQLGLDLRHQPVQHPGAAVEAAAAFPGVSLDPGSRGPRW